MMLVPYRSELGRAWFQLGPFTIEWFDGGGHVESYLMWRYEGVPMVIMLSASA